MSIIQVNLLDPVSVQVGIKILMQHQQNVERTDKLQPVLSEPKALEAAIPDLKNQKIWNTLVRIANLRQSEFSLPELAKYIDLPSTKTRSFFAILRKPELRLGIRLFEKTLDEDEKGNTRYRMPDAVKEVIRNA